MKVSRARAIALLGSAALLPQCAGGDVIRVGSKNFTESIIIAEIYAQALENAGMRVARRLNLGSTEIALAALEHGDIDLYPEYTGTALIDVLHRAPLVDPRAVYDAVRAAFLQRYGLVWLEPSPLDDSQALATTPAIARRYGLRTLSDLAGKARLLRLATIPEFITRPDGLPGLQRVYGGFHFASVHVYDIALKYRALMTGQADIATAFSTDGAIATDRLQVLIDDRHLWPPYNVAPVVRSAALKKSPRIAAVLNRIAPAITSSAAARMNAAVENQNVDPADIAAAFLKGSP